MLKGLDSSLRVVLQEPVVGVIFNPLLDEMYTAWRGGGAFLNGKPIR